MPDIVQTTVNTKTGDLFRFMLFHAYSKISGALTLVLSIISLVMFPISYLIWKDNLATVAFGIIVVIYLIITPLNMFSQSRRQVLSNPVFKNLITYHISEEIFEVQQYTGTARFYWSQLLKIRITPFDYLFYVNSEQAFILPKKSVDPEEVELLNKILDSVKEEVAKKNPSISEEQGKNNIKEDENNIKEDENNIKEYKVKDNNITEGNKKIKRKEKVKKKNRNGNNVYKKTDKLEKQLMEMASKDSEEIIKDIENTENTENIENTEV